MKSHKGFTLIELLVVIAIILVLAAILFPIFKKAREQARKNTCQANMVQIGKAIKSYLVDNEDTFPTNYDYPPPPATGNPTHRKVHLAWLSPPPPSTSRSPGNWVEGLQPNLEKLEDMRGRETMMKCPAASSDMWRPTTSTMWANGAVTYSLNWYIAGENESMFPELASTLMLRELDRVANAALRPCPPAILVAGNITGENIKPLHWSLSWDGTGSSTWPTGVSSTISGVDPDRHLGGSIIVFGDGHSKWLRASDAAADLMNDDDLDPTNTIPPNAHSQGWRTISSNPFWICPP